MFYFLNLWCPKKLFVSFWNSVSFSTDITILPSLLSKYLKLSFKWFVSISFFHTLAERYQLFFLLLLVPHFWSNDLIDRERHFKWPITLILSAKHSAESDFIDISFYVKLNDYQSNSFLPNFEKTDGFSILKTFFISMTWPWTWLMKHKHLTKTNVWIVFVYICSNPCCFGVLFITEISV